MRRTTVYLREAQRAALAEVSRSRGISRAKLIRELIDSGISKASQADLGADLAAIEESFAVLEDGDEFVARGPDDRDRDLDRVNRPRFR